MDCVVGGLDVHKKTVAACVRIPGRRGQEHHVRTFGTTTGELLALRDSLQAHAVTHVAMDSTGMYWSPSSISSRTHLRACWPMPPTLPRSRARRLTCRTVDGSRSCWNTGGSYGELRAASTDP